MPPVPELEAAGLPEAKLPLIEDLALPSQTGEQVAEFMVQQTVEVVPAPLAKFRRMLCFEGINHTLVPEVTAQIFELPPARVFVTDFARYKHLLTRAIPRALDKQRLVSELISVEGRLGADRTFTNNALIKNGLSPYRLHMGWTISDPQHPDYVKGLTFKLCENVTETPLSERSKLRLLLVPKSYKSARAWASRK